VHFSVQVHFCAASFPDTSSEGAVLEDALLPDTAAVDDDTPLVVCADAGIRFPLFIMKAPTGIVNRIADTASVPTTLLNFFFFIC
jgi:hypothetical protein